METTHKSTVMTHSNLIHDAIDALDATVEEREALHEILHVEGFGGREDATDAVSVANERLAWWRNEVIERRTRRE